MGIHVNFRDATWFCLHVNASPCWFRGDISRYLFAHHATRPVDIREWSHVVFFPAICFGLERGWGHIKVWGWFQDTAHLTQECIPTVRRFMIYSTTFDWFYLKTCALFIPFIHGCYGLKEFFHKFPRFVQLQSHIGTFKHQNQCWKKPRATLPETNSSPLKIGHPKRKFHLPCKNLRFREANDPWKLRFFGGAGQAYIMEGEVTRELEVWKPKNHLSKLKELTTWDVFFQGWKQCWESPSMCAHSSYLYYIWTWFCRYMDPNNISKTTRPQEVWLED